MEKKHQDELKEHIEKVIKSSVEENVKKVVNGKIDKLVYDNREWQDNEIIERNKMKETMGDFIVRADPALKFFEDISATKRIAFWAAGALATFGAAYLAISKIFK